MKRSEILARAILDDIAGASPGTPLGSEADLVSHYNVARNTIREALRILEVLGLIGIKPGAGGGPVVAAVGPRDFGNVATLYFRINHFTFQDLIVARRELETAMVRLACGANASEMAGRLLDAIHDAERADPDDAGCWIAAHGSFHERILEAGGVSILALFGKALRAIHEDWEQSHDFPRADRADTEKYHRAIAEAIFRRDADLASALMHQHMDVMLERDARLVPGLMDRVIDWKN